MRRPSLAPAAILAVLLAVAAPAGAATLVSQYAVSGSRADASGLSGAGQTRLGGFGSDLSYDAATGTFYGTTDRGPGGGVLPYQPRLQAFTLDIDRATGAIRGFDLQATTLFTQANGDAYTGLNPTLASGSMSTLGGSLDPEGLARLPNGHFLVSDEYGPSVIEFDQSGRAVRTFAVPANLVPRRSNGSVDYTGDRDKVTTGRQDNRGFEGLTVSADGKTAYAMLQDPLFEEGANGAKADGRYSRNVRIVQYDVATGQPTKQYIYQLESLSAINDRIDGTDQDFEANRQGRSIGISAIQALPNGTLLVLERDNRGLGVDDPNAALTVGSKRIWQVDLSNATDVSTISLKGRNDLPDGVTPVAKSATPFIDLAAALKAMGLSVPEKIEGFTFGPRLADGSYTLIVATDNDYSVTQNGGGTQFDVCTSGPGGVNSTVALGAGCPQGQRLLDSYLYSFRLSAAEYASLAGVVPEPATWATMTLGFGLVGAATRRRRRGAMAAA